MQKFGIQNLQLTKFNLIDITEFIIKIIMQKLI